MLAGVDIGIGIGTCAVSAFNTVCILVKAKGFDNASRTFATTRYDIAEQGGNPFRNKENRPKRKPKRILLFGFLFGRFWVPLVLSYKG